MSRGRKNRKRGRDLDPFKEAPHFQGYCARSGGKRRYATKTEAKRDIKRAAKHGKRNLTYAYQCKHCGDWHTTSMPRPPATIEREQDDA